MMMLFPVAALAAAALLVAGFTLGYPPPTTATDVLSAKEQAIVRACADAMFPSGGVAPASGTEAGVVEYFAATLREGPRATGVLIRLLLRFVEHGPWLFGSRRLTRQSPEARVRTLAAWEASPIYFLRLSFTSLRALIAMGYVANAAVSRDLGLRYGARGPEVAS